MMSMRIEDLTNEILNDFSEKKYSIKRVSHPEVYFLAADK